ncbi:hypothetical protein PENSPDRAFT_688056 [Peniophora sp. CONT]|nr:hypothetical protein PENSPDRAFT_688056 [Peniophora sp. CONT]
MSMLNCTGNSLILVWKVMTDALAKLDILNAVLACMDVRDLVPFALTCRFNHASVRAELRRRITIVLSSHIPRTNISDFLNLLCDTDSVVSGSSALAVLSWNTQCDFRGWPTARDLDIYVPRGGTQPFIDFLQHLDYAPKFTPVSRQIHYARINGVRTVSTLIRLPESIPFAPTTVDIIESTRRSAMWPLCHFWGTVVNNFISARSLVSAYPVETLDGVCVVNPDIDVFENVLDKYRARGFKLVMRKMRVADYFKTVDKSRSSLFLTHSSKCGDAVVDRFRRSRRAPGTAWRWVDWEV